MNLAFLCSALLLVASSPGTQRGTRRRQFSIPIRINGGGAGSGAAVEDSPIGERGVGASGDWRYVRFSEDDPPDEVAAFFCRSVGLSCDAVQSESECEPFRACASSIATGVEERQDRHGTVEVAYPAAYGATHATRERVARKAAAEPFRAPPGYPPSLRDALAPLCEVPFAQRTVGAGRLQRLASDNGAFRLQAEAARPQPLVILLRLHPRQMRSNLRGDVEGVLDVGVASVVGLGDALRRLPRAQRVLTTVVVALNGFDDVAVDHSEGAPETQWKRWVQAVLQSNSDADGDGGGHFAGTCAQEGDGGVNPCSGTASPPSVRFLSCPAGNTPSYNCMMRALFNGTWDSALAGAGAGASAGDDAEQGLVFLLEDDYVLLPSAVTELVEFFASHNPCFAAPYDGADRYLTSFNEDDGAITLVAGKYRHWRSVHSLSVTFAARLGVLRYFRQLLPRPTDDYDMWQRIVAELAPAGGTIMTPLPGLASHVENIGHFSEPYVSLYADFLGTARAQHDRGVRHSAFPARAYAQQVMQNLV